MNHETAAAERVEEVRAAADGWKRAGAVDDGTFEEIFRRYPEIHWRVTAFYPLESPDLCVYFTDSWGTTALQTPYRNKVVTLLAFDAGGRITQLSDYFKDTSCFAAAPPCRCRDAAST